MCVAASMHEDCYPTTCPKAHGHRAALISIASYAQLAVAVASPAPEAAAICYGTRMNISSGDGSDGDTCRGGREGRNGVIFVL
jgi:hypothetical protein